MLVKKDHTYEEIYLKRILLSNIKKYICRTYNPKRAEH